jgi:heat-inducible transcriptional repressor
MELENLTEKEIVTVKENLSVTLPPNVLKEASRLLGMLSHYLSIVEIPHIKELVVEKIELVDLSSTKLLVVIALDSNFVRTVTLETHFEYQPADLTLITDYINEKVCGKPLSFLRENFNELISDFEYKDTPLLRLFVDSVDKIFENTSNEEKLLIAGTQNLLNYPEFEGLDKIKSVIEIIENEDIIIHLLDKKDDSDENIRVFIGSEMQHNTLEDYSLVVSSYRIGSARGSVGLIGPKRMNYSKMMALVQYFGQVLSKIG